MAMKRRGLIVLFALLLAACPAFAQASGIFLNIEKFVATQPVKWSPTDSSKQTAAELAELHRIQDSSTPADVQHAKDDNDNNTVSLFANVLGPAFLPHELTPVVSNG